MTAFVMLAAVGVQFSSLRRGAVSVFFLAEAGVWFLAGLLKTVC